MTVAKDEMTTARMKAGETALVDAIDALWLDPRCQVNSIRGVERVPSDPVKTEIV